MNRQRNNRRGVVSSLLFVGAAVCVIAGTIAWFYFNRAPKGSNLNLMTVQVEKGNFVAKVLDQGEVQSSENVEIRCEVRARNGQLTVISLVPEGTKVKAGDFLVRLDSTAFEKERESQRISVANAKASVIQAKATLDTAKTTLIEYKEGTFKAQEQDLVNQITDAEGLIKNSESELLQAQDVYKNSMELQAKGFITSRQLEADKFAVDRAKLTLKRNQNLLDLTKQNKEVLIKYTKEKEMVQLQSNIEAAKVKLESEKDALRVQENQMAEIEAMIKKCEVVVPEGISGQVVYAKEQRGRGGDEWVLEEGANVRESQVLIRLPDTNKMEVKALINEQNITQIEKGMPASIKVDALTDRTLKGVVTKVNQYAESSGWGGSSVRKYAVKVRIIDPPEALKPGMNSSVSIQTKYEPDALMVPIQTVYGVQEQQFCLVKNGDEYETREIKIGGNNSQKALILEGLAEGDELVMNPGAFKELMDLPEVKLDKRIEISEEETKAATGDVAKKEQKAGGGGKVGQGRSGRGAGSLPENGAAFIASKDTNGDGKLSKDEAGSPYTYFFDRIDKDSDGFLSESEADDTVKAMKKRMQQGGGRPGGGGGRPGGR